jgi:hypothetical protein
MLFVPFPGLKGAVGVEHGQLQAVAIVVTSAAFVWHVRRGAIPAREDLGRSDTDRREIRMSIRLCRWWVVHWFA